MSARHGFEEFVATNERRLRHALTAACGVSHGREVAADALAYAWEHWGRVGAMTNPAGYLSSSGATGTAGRRRTGARSRRRPRRRARRAVVRAGLQAQLERLSERERIVVLLANGFEWTSAEIAELLGVSKSTVQTHAAPGMAKLRAGLGVTP